MEGVYIYYRANESHLEIRNFQLAPQPEHWVLSRVPERNLTVQFECRMLWSNLKAWLHDYYHGYVEGIAAVDGYWSLPFGKAFDMVDTMQDMPWSMVEAVLETYKEGLNALCFGPRRSAVFATEPAVTETDKGSGESE